jgi:hypothetical protein
MGKQAWIKENSSLGCDWETTMFVEYRNLKCMHAILFVPLFSKL